MSLPVEEIENLLSEIERARPYEAAAIASRIRYLVDQSANGDEESTEAQPPPSPDPR